MKRRLFNAAALVSLLLCAALAALWVRSYWRADARTFTAGGGRLEVTSVAGSVCALWG
jgi:hypothetical protein